MRRALSESVRERYGSVLPTWELRMQPTPLWQLLQGGPDTPRAIEARRRLLELCLQAPP